VPKAKETDSTSAGFRRGIVGSRFWKPPPNLGGSKRWEDVTDATFRNMARKVGVEERLMASWMDQAQIAILDSWRINKADFG
jgi:hypothetical protein